MTKCDLQAILLMGPPGSGKGTLGNALSSLTGLIHLSTGDILRSSKKSLTEDRGALINKGNLLPDTEIAHILENYLDGLVKIFKLAPQDIFLLDGFPRTAKQTILLQKLITIKAVLLLDVPFETAQKRINHRAKQEQRKDDRDANVFANRYAIYLENQKQIFPLLTKDQIISLDGAKGPLEVLSKSLSSLISTMPGIFS